jgi:hypothetical protein
MSGVIVVGYLLANNAALLAEVPAVRIKSGDLPLNTVLPAIGIKEISGNTRKTVAMTEPKKLWTDRVQVTVFAKDYPKKKAILKLVRAALPNTRATVNGVDCDSIIDDIVGPDFDDMAETIYQQSQDFIVKYNQ